MFIAFLLCDKEVEVRERLCRIRLSIPAALEAKVDRVEPPPPPPSSFLSTPPSSSSASTLLWWPSLECLARNDALLHPIVVNTFFSMSSYIAWASVGNSDCRVLAVDAKRLIVSQVRNIVAYIHAYTSIFIV